MNIFYRLGNNLFVNITNSCSCDCIFCIRNSRDGMNKDESLWLEREPSLNEIKAAFNMRSDLNDLDEIVFCGFGEPMERADDVIELAHYFKSVASKPSIRLNTNGLVRLIHPDFDITKLSIFNTISISLNADDTSEYTRVTRPRFGEKSYGEMLSFAEDAKKFANIILTVVGILEPHRIENCRKIADNLGTTFRVR
ncbi:MAG: TatD family nuclease-associated radical SAM protein [Defluviitaleaceae bacterium]|nr:TatD family nuclease-associated radical SAM protein [Defluviitaleaceae bacterium]